MATQLGRVWTQAYTKAHTVTIALTLLFSSFFFLIGSNTSCQWLPRWSAGLQAISKVFITFSHPFSVIHAHYYLSGSRPFPSRLWMNSAEQERAKHAPPAVYKIKPLVSCLWALFSASLTERNCQTFCWFRNIVFSSSFVIRKAILHFRTSPRYYFL